jgi:hypothetical protein
VRPLARDMTSCLPVMRWTASTCPHSIQDRWSDNLVYRDLRKIKSVPANRELDDGLNQR